MSHLRVYDTEAPDGLAGGTPHLHTLCTEAYAVVAGTGRVQTLTTSGFREMPFEPGALVWFTPGTIHRLVNDGGLEILVLMQNAGLPEAGDMVITFEPDVVPTPALCGGRHAARRRADNGGTGTRPAAPDAAVSAFLDLAEAVGDGGTPRCPFHASAAALVRPQLDRFGRGLAGRPAGRGRPPAQLAALAAGDTATSRRRRCTGSIRRRTSGGWAAAARSARTSPCKHTRRRRSATLPGDPGGGHEPVTHRVLQRREPVRSGQGPQMAEPGNGERSSAPRRAVAAPRARPVHGGRQEEDPRAAGGARAPAQRREHLCAAAQDPRPPAEAPRSGPVEVVANGRSDWIGWVELVTEHVDEEATQHTAMVIDEVGAQILGVVEAEARPVLEMFSAAMLEKVGSVPYEQVMLIDGNDKRGIDVGLLARGDYPIHSIRSHIFDEDAKGKVFSRDCCEYHLTTPGGETLVVMVNHFKSKGYGDKSDPIGAKRRERQAEQVAKIYEGLVDEGIDHIAVLGDLNDDPSSTSLRPLLEGTKLQDISEHPNFDFGTREGTFGSGNEKDKIDYVLLSPSLFGRATGGGVFRKGVWRGSRTKDPWDIFPTMTEEKHQASDHAAIYADLEMP